MADPINPAAQDLTWMSDDEPQPPVRDSSDNGDTPDDPDAPSTHWHPNPHRPKRRAPSHAPVAAPRRPKFTDPDQSMPLFRNSQLTSGTRKRDRDITR